MLHSPYFRIICAALILNAAGLKHFTASAAIVDQPSRRVVLIDSALVDRVPEDELAGSEVIAINGDVDVVAQITGALGALTEIDVLRVVSHGSDGTLWFGKQAFDSSTLRSHSAQVADWRKSLSAGAEILLYGCSVAETGRGRLFVNQLASLTDANVAASTDPTGRGGNTILEYTVGLPAAGLMASHSEYERAGMGLGWTTWNHRLTFNGNNQDGTASVTLMFDVDGDYHYSDGTPNGRLDYGPLYLYVNGVRVATKDFSDGKDRFFTGNYALAPGVNVFRVSKWTSSAYWSNDPPATYEVVAPYFYGAPAAATAHTVSVGNSFSYYYYAAGTGPVLFTATGLPAGLTMSSGGVISGYPRSGGAGVYLVNIRASNGFGTRDLPVTFTITNQAPGFASTTPAVLIGGIESTPLTINYALLAATVGATDPNNSIIAAANGWALDPISFRIESVPAGTLTKNGSPVTSGSTSIGAGESLVWTPPDSVNGSLEAFTVRAYDGAHYSATTKSVKVSVGVVNDAPTLTHFSGPITSGNEDSAIPITFAALAAKGDQADIDSTVIGFVVKEVTTGTLKIGTSEATAAPWNASTNKVIAASLNGYWTPAPNANGTQSALKVVARDDGQLESAAPVQAVASVSPVIDAPTLTTIDIISGQTEGTPIEISFTSIAAAADEADVDADIISFRIETVSSGTLQKWNGSTWIAVIPGTTLIAASDKVLWIPADGSTGLQNALTLKAWDGQNASANAVQLKIDAALWIIRPWTNEASAGLDPRYLYSHAYSFGATGSFTLGGISFTGISGGNPAVLGKFSTSNFASSVTNDANNLSDASRNLANDFVHGSGDTSAQTITLSGLTPGGRYVVSLFSVGAEDAARNFTFQSTLGQVAVNQNFYGNNQGIRSDYKYLADAYGSATITITPSHGSFNLYGFTNREYVPSIGIYAPASLTYDASAKSFQAYNMAQGASFVSAGVLHSVVLKSDGTVATWGTNDAGQTSVPAGLSDVVAVSAGGYHTLVLKSNGTVVAWGSNSSGQASIPVGLNNAVAISAGKVHNLALKSDGTVIAWGSNFGGQSNVPAGLSGIVAISAGASHSMALRSDGTVVAWGVGFYNYATPPAGLTDVVAISAGEWHSLALKSDGTVVAWGNNGSFQSQVPEGLKGVVAISAGASHSVAVKSDGTVVAWGDRDNYGMTNIPAGLGDVVAIDAGSEHSVALKSDGTVVSFGWFRFGQKFLPTALGPLVGISTGNNHTLALKPDGTVIAWGDNTYGQTSVPNGLAGVVAVQAGDALSVALKSDKTVVAWGGHSSSMPAGLTGVERIAVSARHVLALKSNGTVVAWGDNTYGQCNVPGSLTNVTAIAAGPFGSLALKADGTVVFWGNEMSGLSYLPQGLSGVTAISAGTHFGMVVKSDGSVVAWGKPSETYWNPPAGLSGVTAIEAGDGHALALKSDGSVVAWGGNDRGEATVPASVNGVGVIALTAGWQNSIALKSDGTIVAWGNNTSGKNSPSASAQFPPVGIFTRSYDFSTAYSYSYAGRGDTPYGPSATAPINAGDYTVTVINTSGTRSISQNFTIQKITPTLSYLNRTNSIPYGTGLGSSQVDSVGPYGWNQGTYGAIPGTKVYSPAIGAILPVGTHTLGVTFLPTDSINYNPAVAYAAGTLTVTKTTNASENITLPTLTNLTFNGSAKTHEASAAGVNGFSYTYTGRVGTSYGPSSRAPVYAGSYTVTATVNDPNYTGAKSLDFTIAKATPTITTNPTAAAIAYGQSLASSALTGGVASVPGTFSFATPSTTPGVGTESHTVVFTPADTLNYNTTSGSSSVAVNVASINSSSIVFTPAASLIYNGTAKTFIANAQGIATGFSYSYSGISGTGYGPTSTAPTNAGNYAVTATVTNTNYTGSATQTFTVAKDTPTIAWAAPAGIAYYTALSATQLNATANTAGAFAYMPASGAVLGVGAHVLQTVFTPNDTTNYATVTASVPLQVTSPQLPIVLRAAPNLTYDGTTKPYRVSQNAYLSAGQEHALALKANGTVVAWGRNTAGQATVPSGLTDVVQVVAGSDFSAAVKANGTVVTWGSATITSFTNLNLVNNAVAAAAGNAFIAVLRADGTVTSFGGSWSTQTLAVPAGLSGVTAIAAGEDHVLALKADGTVVAWGGNSSGQATVPAGLGNVVAVAANGTHSLGLKADGTVVAWGDNSMGQCNVPTDLTGVVEITAGSYNSYALKADGTVVGWGNAYTNVVPADVTGAAALAAGGQHAFAIKTDGTVAAWGRIKNNSGSDSIAASTFVPSPLGGVGNFSFSYSYAGRSGTTYPAISSAPANAGNYTLTVSSTLPNYSHGKTVDFTIARATPTITTLPQASIIIEGQALSASTLKDGMASLSGTFAFNTPSFVPSAGTTLQSITFTPTDSTNHASVTAAVTVRSQGGSAATPNIPTLPTAASITFGQRLQDSILSGGAASVPGAFVFSSALTVPNPGTANQSVTFIPTDIVSHAAVTFFVPLTVNDGIVSPLNISLIPPATLDYDGSPKGFQTVRGSLLSYGNGYMLVVKSDGTVEAKAPPGWPSLSMPQGLTGVVGVSAGSGSYRALKSDGTIVEWGSTYLQGTAPAGLSGVVAITSGDYHSLALKSNGTVVAWGLNSDGQSNVPAGLSNVVAIAASSNASFGLKSNGTVVAWGSNSHGQCDVPVGLSGVIAISAGKNGTVAALKSDGTVVCWGRNDSEQATVPAGLKNVVAVSVGHNHTVALKADGTVVAWGMDTILAFFSKNLVPYNLTDVVAISAGQDKTYALKSDGSVVWWGASANAEQYTANGVLYVVYAITPLLPADSAGFAFTATYTGREGTTYASSSTPPTEPGNYSVTVTGTDPDFAATKTIDFTIAKGRPTILSNPFPSGISYGESLASYPLLEGTASVPGTFAFEDPSTIPNAGDSTHNLVFTPADNEHYQPVTVAMEVRVSKATPALVALPTATTLIHGQTLAEATLANGITSVSGIFTFTSTAAVSAGTTRQTVTFTPDDTTNYSAFTTELDVTVALATPSILTSPTATPIARGQTLSSSTLNGGAASVEGTFTWENPNTAPDIGTTTQNFVFTPNDTTNYYSTTGTVSVTVNKTAPTVTSPPTASAITYGQSLSASTLDGGEASVAGSFAWTNPGTGPNAGTASHAFTFTPDDTTNYQATIGMVDVTVHKAFATVILGNLKATYNGTPRAASVLTSPEGLTTVITYNGEDTVPSDAGTYELSATIDDANFTGTRSELLTIEPAVIVLRASAKVAATSSISVSKVATRASRVFGSSVTIASVGAASEEGGTVVLAGSSIQYTPAVGFAGVDRFRVTFSSSGGDLVGLVEMTTTGTGSGPSSSSSLGVNPARLTPLSNGRIGVQFNGIPGVAYQLQRSTDLVSWTTVTTITAGPRGAIDYTDENPPSPNGFYRLSKP